MPCFSPSPQGRACSGNYNRRIFKEIWLLLEFLPWFSREKGFSCLSPHLYPLKSTHSTCGQHRTASWRGCRGEPEALKNGKKKEQKCTGSGVSALGLLWAAPGGTEGAELQRSGCGRALAAERGRGRVRAAAGLSLHRDQIQHEDYLLAASVSSPIPKFSDIRSNALFLRPERSLKHFQGQVMS